MRCEYRVPVDREIPRGVGLPRWDRRKSQGDVLIRGCNSVLQRKRIAEDAIGQICKGRREWLIYSIAERGRD